MILFLFAFGSLVNILIIIISFGALATGGALMAIGKRAIVTRFNLVISVFVLLVTSAITFIISITIFIVVILPNSQAYNTFNNKVSDNNFSWIQLIKPLPKTTAGGNMNFKPFEGGLNGLNLMLINNIKTNDYVKQWLSLGAELQQGKLDPYKSHISLEAALGTTLAEQGFYPGAVLPTSMLGWNPSTHSPYLNVARGWTLTKVGKNQLSCFGGEVPVFTPDLPSGGNGYTGPFQETNSMFSSYSASNNFQYSGPATGYNPTGTSSNRLGDPYYFPDELANLDMYWQQVVLEQPSMAKVNDHAKAFLLSLCMNAGEGAANTEIMQGGSDKVSSMNTLADDLYNDMSSYPEAFIHNLGQTNVDTPTLRAGTVIMALKNGWRFVQGQSNSTAKAQIMQESRKWLPYMNGVTSSQLQSWMNQEVPGHQLPGIPNKDGDGYLQKTIDGHTYDLSYIGLGHEMITEIVGVYEYGMLLQLEKVPGVAVNQMTTYLNHIRETNPKAWLPPSGANGWEEALNYPSNANPVATAVLNYGMQWLRLPYSENCRPINLPVLQRSDCSSFVWWIIDQVTGKSISSAGNEAYTGNEYQMFQQIPLSQAMPGDLIFFGSPPYAHVAMIVSGNSLSNLIIMNEATTKAGANVYGPSFGIRWDINNFGNYTVYNLQPFYQQSQIHQPAAVPHYTPIQWNTSNPYMMALKAAGYGNN